MYRIITEKILIIILLIFCSTAFADVNGDLNNFFSNLGFAGNVTSGSAYQGQEAGFYSGGSVFLRNQVRDIQIMHLDAPSFRSGCGGIDLFAGGFSFINDKALVEFFKKIMSNAEGYALNLALETEVPEIAHAMQYIQQIAQKINNSNLNSCDMAEDMVGGLWPKTRASQQQVCQDIGSQNNVFSDWTAARVGCSTGDDFNKEINDAENDPNYKGRVIINKNLIWDSILRNSFLTSDTELAELFMSLSGTIIYDQNGKIAVYHSLSSSRNLVKALLNGGSARIYVCDENKKCLNPEIRNITINKDGALNQQVIKMINSMVQQVQNDTPLTDAQKGFLNTVSVPVLKFITVSLSLKMGADALDMVDYSGLIAKDLLKQYMLEVLQIVEQSLVTGDYTPEIQHRLKGQIQTALQDVENIQVSGHEDLQDSMRLIQNTRVIEKQATANMTSQLKNNLNFNGDKT